MKTTDKWIISRRRFLGSSIAAAAGLSLPGQTKASTNAAKAKLRFGIVTDSHYADAPDRGARCYRKSFPKMQECIELMNSEKVDFLIELGDFKDQGKPVSEESTLSYLKAIEKVYAGFKGPRYHVLGNHDMDSISKSQFLANVENTGITKEASYYSFDMGGIHCIVMDANYKSDETDYDHGNYNWKDANIPPKEIEWLKKDLAAAKTSVICFTHQELNGEGSAIKNAPEVCRVLAESDKVLAVFQGHHHAGAYVLKNSIHYYTLKCMVEGTELDSSSYAIVEVDDDNSIVVTGYRRAVGKEMK